MVWVDFAIVTVVVVAAAVGVGVGGQLSRDMPPDQTPAAKFILSHRPIGPLHYRRSGRHQRV